MARSFRVFLCSTFSDLSEERQSVLDAIRRLRLRHDSMEFFGARTEQPIETCLQEVRASDVLVVIVGHRYGALVPNRGIYGILVEAQHAREVAIEADPKKRERLVDVVLAYTHHDMPFPGLVARSLHKEGIRVVFDRMYADDWMRETDSLLSEAEFLVFFISPHSVSSTWAKYELQVALHRQITGEGGPVVLPVLLQDADVPPLLRQYRWLDLRENIEEGIAELVKIITHRSAGLGMR